VTQDFYDKLAPYYHLIFEDWDASIRRQGEQLDRIIRLEWGSAAQTVLDAAAGIGTQALALAGRGYTVTASDISAAAIARARDEAEHRGLDLRTSVADLRSLSRVHGTFDVVLACDNALPHLLSDAEILQALSECFRCTRPGGGCLISVRDYPAPGQGTEVRPYGIREADGKRYFPFQVWDWDGLFYNLTLYVVEDRGGPECPTLAVRTRYYAIPAERLLALLRGAGFERVRRVDDVFYQPVLVGTRPGAG
jgi:SAM-dependent methyltransferase